MQNICKDYVMGKSTVSVLKQVDLSVEQGDYLAIMGPSGSGKTTLMNIMGLLDLPTSGTCLLAGRDITKCSDNQLADIRNREIGFVFQSFFLLPQLTAVENVALPLLYAGVKKAQRIHLAQEALRTVGLEEKFDAKPNQLSGGQCQRVAIARAIAGRPKLLLADEPTGALDSVSGQQIMELFAQLHADGATIVMITHDSHIAHCADKLKIIHDGVLMDGEEDE